MSFVHIANRCACANLRKTTQMITKYYDQHLQQGGLRSTQFSLLMAISLNEHISISELGNKICRDQTTMTRNLEILKKNDYIQIVRKENDARKKSIAITEAGKKKLTEVMPLWEKAQANIEQALGMTRLNDFYKTLKDLEELVK